jgi:transposase-like protein
LARVAQYHRQWQRVAYNWSAAMNQFAVLDEGRFPLPHT